MQTLSVLTHDTPPHPPHFFLAPPRAQLDSDPINGVVFVSDLNDCLRVVEIDSRQVFSLSRLVPFDAPHGLVWLQHTKTLYACDSNNNCLRRVVFHPPDDKQPFSEE